MLKADALIIGGGVIGLSCSFYLAKEGYKVIVVDKQDFASKASSYNGGLIIPNACIPISSHQLRRWAYKLMSKRLKALKGKEKKDFKKWVNSFLKVAKRKDVNYYTKFLKSLGDLGGRKFEEIIKKYNLNVYYEEKGFISLLNSKYELDEELKEFNNLKDFNFKVIGLDKNDIKERETMLENYCYGIYYPNTSIAYPPSFCSELIKLNKELGVKLISKFNVEGFEVEGKKVKTAKSNDEDIKADYFIISSGAWSKYLGMKLGLDIPIEPAKGYVIEFESNDCKLNNALFFEDKVFGLVKYANNRLRIFGILEFKGFDTSFSNKKFKSMLKHTVSKLPCLKDAKLIEMKSCLRPFSPDELPIIGFTKNYDNLVLACGHGRFGFMLSLITGEIVEKLISNKRINLPMSMLSPSRFA
jgi:D-amino-acid dehydrogenase